MKKSLVFDMDGTLLDSMVMRSDFKNYIINANHEIDDLDDFTPNNN